ncbi:hypothetical protein [Mesorhizobium sp. B2-8-5]|uniref:hypothetical protein n=1 Tax=Mesorhizobium sp. B2-8-5 TaxID=2589903 RepID=UPI00112CAC13|nr:hypothetical protein [Mesorhizobium sp. B2-8-5]UCI23996.1 hypothetical protein FJ430_20580 [Mesorhizobium sp. B2-8-5]
MDRIETPLELAERRIREGEERIARQRALISKLTDQGGHALLYDAVLFLQALEAVQREHVAILARMRR